jgi:hypothetical protein
MIVVYGTSSSSTNLLKAHAAVPLHHHHRRLLTPNRGPRFGCQQLSAYLNYHQSHFWESVFLYFETWFNNLHVSIGVVAWWTFRFLPTRFHDIFIISEE